MAEATHDIQVDGSNALAFRSAYAAAFRAFLDDGSETALRAAYELGRGAVHEVGLLELAHVHNAVLLSSLTRFPEDLDSQRIANAASDFLLEVLSAYEMVRRGFAEARETVAYERRQAGMIRRLSSLLADASLAVRAHSSSDEMLQIVVEDACELTRAAWCIGHANAALSRPTPILVSAGSEPPDLATIVDDVYAAFGPRNQATELVRVGTPSREDAVIAAPLTALDGRTVGFLAIAADGERKFTELDEAVLIHISQMAAAALERAMGYQAGLG
jgi:GAF domain-containing protein